MFSSSSVRPAIVLPFSAVSSNPSTSAIVVPTTRTVPYQMVSRMDVLQAVAMQRLRSTSGDWIRCTIADSTPTTAKGTRSSKRRSNATDPISIAKKQKKRVHSLEQLAFNGYDEESVRQLAAFRCWCRARERFVVDGIVAVLPGDGLLVAWIGFGRDNDTTHTNTQLAKHFHMPQLEEFKQACVQRVEAKKFAPIRWGEWAATRLGDRLIATALKAFENPMNSEMEEARMMLIDEQ